MSHLLFLGSKGFYRRMFSVSTLLTDFIERCYSSGAVCQKSLPLCTWMSGTSNLFQLNLTFLALILAPPHPDIHHFVMAWWQFL